MHKEALSLLKNTILKKQISDANLRLSKLYERTGDMAASYKY